MWRELILKVITLGSRLSAIVGCLSITCLLNDLSTNSHTHTQTGASIVETLKGREREGQRGTEKERQSTFVPPQTRPTMEPCSPLTILFLWIFFWSSALRCSGNHDAKRLYDDLLKKRNYNKLIRPVENNTNKLTVKMGLKLAQVIDVDVKNEIITLNMWIKQQWNDSNLSWTPHEYGGVTTLYVPSESIWLPDIVLYNNADGDYNITLLTKATLYFSGEVTWEPPVILKSQCDINVMFFPFDEQMCKLKFGSWSYGGDLVDLQHIWAWKYGTDEEVLVEVGIDTTDYYPNVEWDLMAVPAKKNIKYYPCCEEPYPDITFNFTLRRKTLFYSINLIIPCVCINMLTALGFYLPSDCGEKISLCISILLSLSIFQLLLMDLVPPTSLTLPLMGKYLCFTCALVTVSVFSSVMVLNVNFRSSSTHVMPHISRVIFLEILPRLLFMRRPFVEEELDEDELEVDFWSNGRNHLSDFVNPYKRSNFTQIPTQEPPPRENRFGNYSVSSTFIGIDPRNVDFSNFCDACAQRQFHSTYPPNALKALEGSAFIGRHMKEDNDGRKVRDDWKFLALVIDRLLLWIYTAVCLVGGMGIMLNAPVLYDHQQPLPRNYTIDADRALL